MSEIIPLFGAHNGVFLRLLYNLSYNTLNSSLPHNRRVNIEFTQYLKDFNPTYRKLKEKYFLSYQYVGWDVYKYVDIHMVTEDHISVEGLRKEKRENRAILERLWNSPNWNWVGETLPIDMGELQQYNYKYLMAYTLPGVDLHNKPYNTFYVAFK